MELVVVDLDIGAELTVTEYVEVAGAELDGSIDLGRWMEHSHNGRREYRRGHVAWARAAPAIDSGRGRHR
jgi:hypothetical protein